jgi:hypothetical protein
MRRKETRNMAECPRCGHPGPKRTVTHLRDKLVPKAATLCGRIILNNRYKFSTTPTCKHCLRKAKP